MTGDKNSKVDSVKQHAPPFSVRLTLAERARLDKDAGQLPIGEYVRMQLFDRPDARQRVYRRPVQDVQLLGQVLAALGNSRMAGNLYQIVRAVHAGELVVTAAQQKDLEEALVNVRDMRQWLIAALGLQPDRTGGIKEGGARGVPPVAASPPAVAGGSSGEGENP